ncbi:cation diffusion facilitator family transporter [Clostridium tunisiense]|uniref:cation diffusion facilitator family transporter n=1 Tax=Clostridium tunisiense TaxID=219748 RepID=UPI0003070933|nr:cation diffusion facilitator family transporter [Clostridium tunisiense]
MISNFLIKKFIANYSDVKNKKVREKYGYLGGIVGIVVNLLLFGVKFTVGLIVNSIAVTADAFNNLSDVGSSLVTIFGFKLSSKPADREHPFGHGRIEYISGLIVAFLVLMVGFEFVKSSFDRIKNPTPVEFSFVPFILLLISILFKVWLSKFYKNIGGKINSSALQASGVDALSDVVSSSTVAFSLLISRFTSFPIDGYIGMAVSAVILYAGYNLIKDTLNPLLGTAPDKELVESIQQLLLNYEHIDGTHDLLVHNYGPGRIIASIHAEVPLNISVVKIHEVIDRAEKEISAELDIYLVIHMDPITTDDQEILEAKEELAEALKAFPLIKSFHDFRVVGEGKNKNLIFDVVIDADHELTAEEELKIQKDINAELKKSHPNHNAIVTVDKDYLGV